MAASSAPEEDLAELLAGLPGMVYRCQNDSERTMSYVSPGCVELTGYRREDLVGGRRVSTSDLIHPDDRSRVRDEVQAAVDSGCPFQLEYRIVTATGEPRWVHERGTALSTGSPVRELVGFVGPLPTIRESPLQTGEGEARFRRFHEAAYAGVMALDEEGTIVYRNRAASQILGLNLAEGSRWPAVDPASECVGEDGEPIAPESLPAAVAFRTGQPVRGVVLGQRLGAGETSRWLLVSADPLLDRVAGRIREVVVTSVDITERRAIEQRLQYLLAFESLIRRIALEMVNLDAGEVDSGILRALQEIGQFMDVDRAYLFQLRPDGRLADNTHEWCAAGVSSHIHRLQAFPLDQQFPWLAARLRRLEQVHVPDVTSLPEEARAERLEFEVESIRSLVLVPSARRGQLVGFMGFDSVQEGKTWSSDATTLLQLVGETIGGVLERQRADVELRRSEDRFRTLFQNLSDAVMVVDIHGRLSFETPSLQRLLGLRPEAFEETRVEELVVPADLPRLRQLLAQARGGVQRPQCELGWRCVDGTLVPCEVLAASLPDKDSGTTMLTLRDLRGRPSPEGTRGSTSVGTRPLVLFVDDDSTVRLLAQTVLQRAGYQVLLAADGPPALELFAHRSSEIDVVVLDLTMPKMTGAEVLRALRSVRPDLPVVVSTGYHPSEAMEQLEDLEPGCMLQKPYDSTRLLMAVGEALGQARSAR